MTNEETIRHLEDLQRLYLGNEKFTADIEAIGIAIEALKKQPCEDCISREAVEEMIKAEMPERGMWEIEGDKEKETVCEVCVDLMQKLSELPPVTPQQKIGHWEVDEDRIYTCNQCNKRNLWHSLFCPNCGAKMEEEEE